jgi:hypothetical protein
VKRFVCKFWMTGGQVLAMEEAVGATARVRFRWAVIVVIAWGTRV